MSDSKFLPINVAKALEKYYSDLELQTEDTSLPRFDEENKVIIVQKVSFTNHPQEIDPRQQYGYKTKGWVAYTTDGKELLLWEPKELIWEWEE